MDLDFRALLEHSPNPYVVLDRDYAFVWMNDAYLRTTMRKRGDLLGRTMFEAFPSDPGSESHRLLKASLDRVLRTGESDELALIRYDISGPDGAMGEHFWSATHTPFKDAVGKVAYILQHTVDVTELHELRQLRHEAGVVKRAEALQERYRSMAEEIEQLHRLVDQAPGFVAIVGGPDHRFVLANQAYRELVGRRELEGKTVAEAIPEMAEQGYLDLLNSVLAGAKRYVARRDKVTLKSQSDGSGEQRFLNFILQPIFGGSGETIGIFVQGHDVTEEVEAEERQELLINELNHRVKNTLAIVQSLAAQSFGPGATREASLEAFGARLTALAGAHNLLTDRSWKTANIADLVRISLETTSGASEDRFCIEGPHLELDPQVAVSFAMIMHELATNAVKYGALSNDKGRVEVTWSVQGDGACEKLIVDWRESGGPPVVEPNRKGFGTRLIGRGIGSGRDKHVSLEFPPEGLRCRFESKL